MCLSITAFPQMASFLIYIDYLGISALEDDESDMVLTY